MKEKRLIIQKDELKNCYFVKTILMLHVILYHSLVFWTGGWFSVEAVYKSNLLSYIALWLNSFHIYGFVLVSGYIFYYLKFEVGKYNNSFQFILTKTKRLLIPTLFTTIVWVIPIGVYFFKFDASTIINKYILGITPNQLWFLWMLFIVFVLFYFLKGVFAKFDFLSIIIAFCLYGGSIACSKICPNYFQVWTAFSYIPLFLLGFKIRQHGSYLINKINWAVWIVVDVTIFAVVQVIPNNGLIFKLINLGLEFFLHIIGAIMAFVVLQKIASHVKWQNSKVFTFLSERSIIVYLFHQQVIYFSIYWLNGLVNPFINATLNFIIAITISLLISLVLLKYKWTRFLIGEK